MKPSKDYRSKEVDLLFSFLTKIHNVDGFDRWVTYYKSVLVQLSQNGNFAEFILRILRSADDRVDVLVLEILPDTVSFDGLKKEEKLEIYYYMFKYMEILF